MRSGDELIIELLPYGSKPIYEQLMLEIKRGIIANQLSPGEGMPSVRTLASDIGINMHTVNKVYKHLENDKVLVKQKGGFAVNPKKLSPTADVLSKIEQKIYELVIETQLYGLSDREILKMIQETIAQIKTNEVI